MNHDCLYEHTDQHTEPTVDEILTDFIFTYDPDKEGITEVVEVFKEKGLMELDNGAWDDEYEILGYLPPCPRCRSKMRFNDAADLLHCPECGYSVCGSDYPYRDMPDAESITEDDYK